VSARRVACSASIVALVLALAASAAAYPETWVSFPSLLHQLRTGAIVRVIINPARSDIEIKFRNLDEWHAYYPPADRRELERLTESRHIHLIVVPRHRARATHAAVHHHLRYILAAILGALLVAGAAVALVRRARRRSHGASPRAG
jgi:hypothetical protein